MSGASTDGRKVKHISEAAYILLQGYIKRVKEEIEMEAALSRNAESSEVRGLPEELLSIIVDTDLHEFDNESSRSAVEGYLMSWDLIFQHFIDSVCS